MSNEYFKFKQFCVCQHRCAMKVGTDGTLLGAWAAAPKGKCRILDIGTGTGLVTLMMAQRFPEAWLTGIDIDEEAVLQASDNVKASPFADRIRIEWGNVLTYEAEPFNAIVCNPPYFVGSLTCPDKARTVARHTVSLTYSGLMEAARRLLGDDGLLTIVIPSDSYPIVESEAALAGLFLSRIHAVKTVQRKPPKRLLIELKKHPVAEIDRQEHVLEESPGIRSEWYDELTKDFYIK